MVAEFNQTHVAEDRVDTHGGTGYALAELTRNDLVGFLDPTKTPMEDQQMQANTSLLFWEKKEVDIIATEDPSKAVEQHHRIRLIHVSNISGPVIAFQDFGPVFNHNEGPMIYDKWVQKKQIGAYIFVRPRRLWGSVLLAKSRAAFDEI